MTDDCVRIEKKPMMSPEEALTAVLRQTLPLSGEDIDALEACARVLALPVKSGIRHPLADNSAMDGYAVRRNDLLDCSEERPVALTLVGESRAGAPAQCVVGPGQVARIFTGALIPSGADAVVMQEDVVLEANEANRPIFRACPNEGAHIRRAGENFEVGDELLKEGQHVSPATLGLLASSGVSSVQVHRVPRVAMMTSGDELLPAGQIPDRPELLVDSNTPMLKAACALAGAKVLTADHLKDELPAMTSWYRSQLPNADVIISTGGASVGEYDWISKAWEEVGIETVFWKIAMKPGKPLRFGVWSREDGSRCLVFGLPGNPLSALTGFERFVRPALRRMRGHSLVQDPMIRLPLSADFSKRTERTQFVRAFAHPNGPSREASVPRFQGSSMLRGAGQCALVGVIPAASHHVPKGAQVKAYIEPHELFGLTLEPSPRMPFWLGVHGDSNAGKTRLIEQLIPALKGRGLSVGSVKHAAHRIKVDTLGKDSDRHAKAGSERVLLCGPEESHLFVAGPPNFAEIVADSSLWRGLDIVVVEGFKQVNIPRVHLTRGLVEQWEIKLNEQSSVIHLSAPTIVDGSLDVPKALFEDLVGYITAWQEEHEGQR